MASTNAGTVKYIIEADTAQFTKDLGKARAAVGDFTKDLAKADPGKALGDSFSDGSNTALKAIGALAKGAIDQIAQISKAIGSVAWDTFTTGAGTAATAFADMAAKGVSDTAFLEQQSISMVAFTGSVEEGNKALAHAVDFFKNNPFQRFDVTEATKNLVQFGAQTDEIPGKLKNLGNVSLATGANISDLAYALQRSVSDGRVNVIDLQILANQGVPIWGAFEKALGMTSEQVRELSRTGKLTGKDMEAAFNWIAENGQEAANMFEKTLARQTDRFKGSMSNLRAEIAGYTVDSTGMKIANDGIYASYTSLTRTMADVLRGTQYTAEQYDGLSDSMKNVIKNAGGLDAYNKKSAASADALKNSLANLAKALTPLIEKLAAALPPILEKIGKAIQFVADHSKLLIPIIGGAAVMFGSLAKGLPGIGGVIGNLSGSFQKLAKAVLGTNPIITVLVGLFGTALPKALKNTGVQAAIKSIVDSAKRLFEAFKPVIGKLGELSTKVFTPILIKMIESFAVVLEKVATIVERMPIEMLTGLVLAFVALGGVQKALGPIMSITKALGGAGKAVESVSKVNTAGGGVGQVIANILKPLGDSSVLKGAASVALIGIGLGVLAASIAYASSQTINIGNLLLMLLAGTIVGAIFALVGFIAPLVIAGTGAVASIGVALAILAGGIWVGSTLGGMIDNAGLINMLGAFTFVTLIFTGLAFLAPFAAIGATLGAVIGVGLAITAAGLLGASVLGSMIPLEGLQKLGEAVVFASLVMASVMLFAAFGAVASIATSVMSAGLLLTAAGLAAAAALGSLINLEGLTKLGEAVVFASVVLSSVMLAAIFGSVASIATSVMSAGLLATAAAIWGASVMGAKIDLGGLANLMAAVAFASTVMASIMLLAMFGGVAAVATSVLGAGLLLTAISLNTAAKVGGEIDLAGISHLLTAITLASGVLSAIALMAIFGGIGAIAAQVIGVGLMTTAALLLLASIMMNAALAVFNSINTDGLLDKFNAIEKAVSRDGKGWPLGYAIQFGLYVRALTGSGNLSLVKDFINTVLGWPTENLYTILNDFERAVSRGGEGWPEWRAKEFGNYIKALTGEGKLDLVKDFINTVISWPTDKLLTKMQQFESAVSRGGEGWAEWRAKEFGTYIKALTGEGKLDLVKDFINTVIGWDTKKLKKQLDEFEGAVGQDFNPDRAENFKKFIDKLVGDGKLDLVRNFIDSVMGWDTAAMGGKLIEFNNAIDQDFDPEKANKFKQFVDKLVGDGKLDMVREFINAVVGWDTKKLSTQLSEFAAAIGQGWDLESAEHFKNFIEKLVGEGNLSLVKDFINSVVGWDTRKLGTQLQQFGAAIGQDWDIDSAGEFKSYIDKLTGEGKLELVADFINNVIGWNTKTLGAKLGEFGGAVASFAASASPESAEDFNNYIKKLTGGGDLSMVQNFISTVLSWDTRKLGEKLLTFGEAIATFTEGTDDGAATKFKEYIDELTGTDSLSLVQDFIGSVLGWNTKILGTKLGEFATAITDFVSGDAVSNAKLFKEFIDNLTGDGKLDLIKSFIDSVLGWNTKSLATKLTEFGSAIGQFAGDGNMKESAGAFKEVVDKLAGGGSLELVTSFINSVMGWDVKSLATKLTDFGKAISDFSVGETALSLTTAEQFKLVIEALAGGDGKIELVATFIDKVLGWDTKGLKTKLGDFATAIAEFVADGNLLNNAGLFKDFIDTLVGDGNIDLVVLFIDKVINWNTKTLGGKLKDFAGAINDFVAGEGSENNLANAEKFKTYIDALVGGGSIDLVVTFIDKILGWDTVALGEKLTTFNTAIKNGDTGWDEDDAYAFKDYFNILSQVGDMTNIITMMSQLNELNVGDGAKIKEAMGVLQSVVGGGDGEWSYDDASDFKSFFDGLAGLGDLSSAANILKAFTGLKTDGVAAAAQTLADAVLAIANSINAGVGQFFSAGVNLIDSLQKGWMSVDFSGNIANDIKSLLATLDEKTASFEKLGKDYSNAFNNGFRSINLYDAGKYIGSQMALGLESALRSAKWRVDLAAGDLARNAAKAMADAAKVKSPSRLTMYIGEMMGEGLVVGMESQLRDIERMSQKIADTISSPLEELSDLSLQVTGDVTTSSGGSGYNKSTTINQTNNISGGLSYAQMMADLKWSIAHA